MKCLPPTIRFTGKSAAACGVRVGTAFCLRTEEEGERADEQEEEEVHATGEPADDDAAGDQAGDADAASAPAAVADDAPPHDDDEVA